MGNSLRIPIPSSINTDSPTNSIEVYILYKTLGQDSYTNNRIVSHHVLLFKTSDGRFYYTDLQTEDGQSKNAFKGQSRIKLRFGRYTFFDTASWISQIHYQPVGRTNKSLDDIESYVNSHDSIGTIYSLFNNNCQDYVASVINYLSLPYPNQANTMKIAKTFSDINLDDEFNILNTIRPNLFGGPPNIDMVELFQEMQKFQRH